MFLYLPDIASKDLRVQVFSSLISFSITEISASHTATHLCREAAQLWLVGHTNCVWGGLPGFIHSRRTNSRICRYSTNPFSVQHQESKWHQKHKGKNTAYNSQNCAIVSLEKKPHSDQVQPFFNSAKAGAKSWSSAPHLCLF